MINLEIEFKNLNIGYYFIYDNKIYMKNTDHSAIQIYSDTNQQLFTNANNAFMNIDSDFTYNRPSLTKVVIEPNEIITFIKREDIKSYISEYLSKNFNYVKFKNLPIGSYFKDENNNYYRKLSYYTSIPIYKEKMGIDENENIIISTTSSAMCTLRSINKMHYNGKELVNYDIKSWVIVWFDQNFTTFNYETFDTENDFDSESKKMINYIKNIPDNSIVFLLNTKDSNTCLSNEGKIHSFSKILSDDEEAYKIFESIGFTYNIISNIGKNESILLVSKKNNEIIYYKKIKYPDNEKSQYSLKDDLEEYIIDYVYTFNQSTKDTKIGYKIINKLDEKVINVEQREINLNILYNVSTSNPIHSVINDKTDF